jgi:hypothetical protein
MSQQILKPIQDKPDLSTHDRAIDWTELAREFDGRLNINKDWEIKILLERIKLFLPQCDYVLVGGLERGDNPTQTDYQKHHVHIALRLKNRTSLGSVKTKLGFGTVGGQYYIKVRKPNGFLTYKGWRDHHVKPETKVHVGQNVLFEFGELPKDKVAFVSKKENKYKKIIEMAKNQQWKEIEAEFPLDYIRMAGQLRVKYWRQVDDPEKLEHKQALWLFGQPGTGKSAVIHYLFNKDGRMYKKQLEDKWWDGFDIDHHDCYYLEDVDPEALKKIGIQRMKTWADHTGFAGDKKYGGLDIIRGQCIVSSNYSIKDCIYNHKGIESTYAAFKRRFKEIEINDYLKEQGLQLKSKEELENLKKDENADYSKCFIHLHSPKKKEETRPTEIAQYYQSDDDTEFYEQAADLADELQEVGRNTRRRLSYSE